MTTDTKQLILNWNKKPHADKVLNRSPYRDSNTGALVWRNPALAHALNTAAGV